MKNVVIIAKIVLVTGFLFVLSSCAPEKQTEQPVKKKMVIRVGLDYTGSYSLFKTGVDDLLSVVENLVPGTKICLRELSNDSYNTSNLIEVLTLPEINESSANPFSRKGKIKAKLENDQINAVKSELSFIISKLRSKKYNRTDIDGFLLNCIENLKKDEETVILIVSDLEQNMNKYSKYLKPKTLQGVKVFVLAFQNKDPKTRKTWSEKFEYLGADYSFLEPRDKLVIY